MSINYCNNCGTVLTDEEITGNDCDVCEDCLNEEEDDREYQEYEGSFEEWSHEYYGGEQNYVVVRQLAKWRNLVTAIGSNPIGANNSVRVQISPSLLWAKENMGRNP